MRPLLDDPVPTSDGRGLSYEDAMTAVTSGLSQAQWSTIIEGLTKTAAGRGDVEGSQHGIALLGQSECVDGIVTDHLIDLQTPPDAARCTL